MSPIIAVERLLNQLPTIHLFEAVVLAPTSHLVIAVVLALITILDITILEKTKTEIKILDNKTSYNTFQIKPIFRFDSRFLTMADDKSHSSRGRPKGTPKKNKGFKGTPKKVVQDDQNLEEVLTSIKKGRSSPLGLKNLGQNVCFFNSVPQVLYSNDNFRKFINQFEADCPAKVAMKQLFTLMESSVTPIETYQYVHLMPLLNYNHARKEQYDAHECLLYILGMFYSLNPNILEPSNVFQISCSQSVLCQTCYNPSEKTVYDSYCRIEFPDRFNENSIENEISKLVNDPHGEFLQEAYPCPTCRIRTIATKSTVVFNVADTLIIQLIIFGFDRTTNSSKKLAPNLTIETKIENVLLGTLHLQGIVYHHGNSPNSGHYTSEYIFNLCFDS